MPPNWNRAQKQAARTARWATTMAKWGVSHATGGKRSGTKAVVRWLLVDFLGPNGGESAGIVDAIAIRKDHRPGKDGLKRGDRFEIILLQIKGGAAAMPSASDIKRMRSVADLHGATEVVLVKWKRKEALEYSRLRPGTRLPKKAWEPVKPEVLFGRSAELTAPRRSRTQLC